MTFAANDGMVWHYRDEIEIRKYHYLRYPQFLRHMSLEAFQQVDFVVYRYPV
jgi:hypothetical protein